MSVLAEGDRHIAVTDITSQMGISFGKHLHTAKYRQAVPRQRILLTEISQGVS